MEALYLGIVIFLFALAILDLYIGVSNDAVNFLNSAVGAKAGTYKTVLLVAAVGIFLGSAFSNGMMDLTRHGIFQPEHFTFAELMNVFMAVMVADIILLDIFNSLGLPTSSTVSRVFELLGAAFTLAAVKILSGVSELPISDFINTDKALTVIIAIFLSVTIAFFFGALVQYITRIIFSFNFLRNLKWKIGIFGGVCITAIIYFMLIKGVKDMSFMTADYKAWIADNTGTIVLISLAVTTALSYLLHALGVNVMRIVVLFGTMSLAMAFAGNDLVNFIGVPLSGFEIFGYFRDALANGVADPTTMSMDQLNGPSVTPVYFLIVSGIVMVVSLMNSEKAKNVVKTSVSLSSQEAGDEMFGSSSAARHIVRFARNIGEWFEDHTPANVRRWIATRFDSSEAIMPEGAAFDMVRASVNLVLAGLLVALGTSLKLPLSTTYVTFMVAMGSSLADRAWGRESAVFRITGVISVIGGWLVTAGASFILAAALVTAMHFGGLYVSVIIIICAIIILVRNNIEFKKKANAEKSEKERIYADIVASKDRTRTWELLKQYISINEKDYLTYFVDTFESITTAFENEDVKTLRKINSALPKQKTEIKAVRRKQTMALRKTEPRMAIENNTWLHLAYNSNQQMVYCLMRMVEPCYEHVDNNFAPMPDSLKEQFEPLKKEVIGLFRRSIETIGNNDYDSTVDIRNEGDATKTRISLMRKDLVSHIHEDMDSYSVIYVYLNMLQETQEMISSLRHNLRAIRKIEREL
ncbi:MAG: inorganic phosphate transporter [Bacteroidales bacterium]|nr:inorganic phosphate transporter [Bacteroidales bacterium]